MEKKQDNKETFVGRIKKILEKNDIISVKLEQIRVDLDAKIEAIIIGIRKTRTTSSDLNKNIGFIFNCSVDEAHDVVSFLKEYLHNEGFVKIGFKDQSDNGARGYSGVVNFTIPD